MQLTITDNEARMIVSSLQFTLDEGRPSPSDEGPLFRLMAYVEHIRTVTTKEATQR